MHQPAVLSRAGLGSGGHLLAPERGSKWASPWTGPTDSPLPHQHYDDEEEEEVDVTGPIKTEPILPEPVQEPDGETLPSMQFFVVS